MHILERWYCSRLLGIVLANSGQKENVGERAERGDCRTTRGIMYLTEAHNVIVVAASPEWLLGSEVPKSPVSSKPSKLYAL